MRETNVQNIIRNERSPINQNPEQAEDWLGPIPPSVNDDAEFRDKVEYWDRAKAERETSVRTAVRADTGSHPACNTENSESAASGRGGIKSELSGFPEYTESTVLHGDGDSVLQDEGKGIAEAVDCAIRETMPDDAAGRIRAIFDFARKLKAISSLANVAASQLRQHVQAWHRAAVESNPWLSGVKFLETWAEFGSAWDKVEYAAGDGPVDRLFAQTLTLPMPAAVAEYDDDEQVRRLVFLCVLLQQEAGDQQFFLDCRTPERLLKIHYSTANRWLTGLERDGILSRVSTGSRKTRRANEYRCNIGPRNA
jgi:hypothetical protein